MSGWNGFANLDLSGVTPDDFAPLGVGQHRVRSSDAQVKTSPNGANKRVVVKLTAVSGSGAISAGFNVVHSQSKQAVEIGLAQLKSFLIAGGHPNPDNPGDIATLNGLECDIYIGMGKPYIGQDGRERTNPEVKRFIMDGDAKGDGAATGGATKPKTYDDEIPF